MLQGLNILPTYCTTQTRRGEAAPPRNPPARRAAARGPAPTARACGSSHGNRRGMRPGSYWVVWDPKIAFVGMNKSSILLYMMRNDEVVISNYLWFVSYFIIFHLPHTILYIIRMMWEVPDVRVVQKWMWPVIRTSFKWWETWWCMVVFWCFYGDFTVETSGFGGTLFWTNHLAVL